jgi:hypothetical protein
MRQFRQGVTRCRLCQILLLWGVEKNTRYVTFPAQKSASATTENAKKLITFPAPAPQLRHAITATIYGSILGLILLTMLFMVPALHAFDTSRVLAHNTYAEFYTIPPSEAELGPHRNRAIRDKLMLHNIPVNYERYKAGKVVIKPRLSETPILPEKIGVFMEQVRALLPFESPPVDSWQITHSDFHFPDSPTAEKAKRYITFDHGDTHIVCYNKPLPTGRALRLEAQVNPACTPKGYPAAAERTRLKLLEVIGK